MSRILIVNDCIDLEKGGPARSVPYLHNALCDLSTVGSVLIYQSNINRQKVKVSGQNFNVQFSYNWQRFLGLKYLFVFCYALWSKRPTLVHLNGVWDFSIIFSGLICISLRIPFVLQPRGMLEPWSLRWHKRRKSFLRWLVVDKIILSARCLIATAESEHNNLRLLFPKSRVEIIPNGIPKRTKKERLEKSREFQKTVTYIGRLHPKKGLEDLLYAWKKANLSDWRLKIFGPADEGYRNVLSRIITQLCLGESVSLHQEVDEDQKWQLLEDSDIFVLPTYSENFGIVVLEALSVGVPVLCTKGAPWNILNEKQCGWWVENGVASLANALVEISQLSVDEFVTMGANGQTFSSAFHWNNISEKFVSLYREHELKQ